MNFRLCRSRNRILNAFDRLREDDNEDVNFANPINKKKILIPTDWALNS